jgi:hypothetical protein
VERKRGQVMRFAAAGLSIVQQVGSDRKIEGADILFIVDPKNAIIC